MSASWKASVPIDARADLAGDRDHRDGVHVRVGDRGDEVGGARPGRGHADPDLAGGTGVALGRVAGALLVAHEDVADLDRVQQRVVRREDRAAGDAEDRVDVHRLEGQDQALRPGDLDRGLARGPAGRSWAGEGGCAAWRRSLRHRFPMRCCCCWAQKKPFVPRGQKGWRACSAELDALGEYENSCTHAALSPTPALRVNGRDTHGLAIRTCRPCGRSAADRAPRRAADELGVLRQHAPGVLGRPGA